MIEMFTASGSCAKVKLFSLLWLSGLAPFVCTTKIYNIHINRRRREPGPWWSELRWQPSAGASVGSVWPGSGARPRPAGRREGSSLCCPTLRRLPTLEPVRHAELRISTRWLLPLKSRLLFTRRRLDRRFTDLLMAVRLPAAVNSIAGGAVLPTFSINYSNGSERGTMYRNA